MKFPRIKDVAAELRDINANVEGRCDIRLQVWPDGEWMVRCGDLSYDLDHRGYWGASSVPGCGGKDCQPRRFNARDTARDLIEQAKDQHAQEGGE